MSKQSAKECLEKIENNPAFRAELLKAKTPEERKKFLEKHKFQFTQDEYKQVYKEKHNHPLNEVELRKIAAAGQGDTSKAHSVASPGTFIHG